MLTFRRALIAGALFTLVLFLLSRSHRTASSPLSYADPSPKPSNSQPISPLAGDDDDSLNREEPKSTVDLSKLTLSQLLAYQYPYDVQSKFPAYIWQTWKWAPSDPQFKFRDQEATWTETHPSFVHEVITDEVSASLIQLLFGALPDVMEAYHSLPIPVLRTDFFRYLVLFARGGIYSDIDTYAIQGASVWVPDSVRRDSIGLVIGIEADPDRPDWQEWYSRRIQFCQWTIQAKPGHPVLREIISHITEKTLRLKRQGLLQDVTDNDVVEMTGPALWTDVVFNYMNDDRYFDLQNSPGPIDWHNFTEMEVPRKVGDILVLPITSFSPGVRQMGSKEYDDPMAFVKHDFEGTWKPNKTEDS